MGYNTRYSLTILNADGSTADPDATAWVWAEEVDGGCILDDVAGEDASSCKWYAHDDDMIAISAAHPDLVFQLDGDGEEAGDLWRKWYARGEMREWRPQIDRPSYDPAVFK